jgi:hypothetical protein
VSDDLKFEPPEPQREGDTLRLFIQRGPHGEPIVDTHLSNRRGRRAVGDEVVRILEQQILALTEEARKLSSDPAVDKLGRAIEALTALVQSLSTRFR